MERPTPPAVSKSKDLKNCYAQAHRTQILKDMKDCKIQSGKAITAETDGTGGTRAERDDMKDGVS